jgi:hypothetical protein
MKLIKQLKWLSPILVFLPVCSFALSNCSCNATQGAITISSNKDNLIYDNNKDQSVTVTMEFQKVQSENATIVGRIVGIEKDWNDIFVFSRGAFDGQLILKFKESFTYEEKFNFYFYVEVGAVKSNELRINVVRGKAPLSSLFDHFSTVGDPIILGGDSSAAPSSKAIQHYATNSTYNPEVSTAGIKWDDLSQESIDANYISYVVDHAVDNEYYWGDVNIYYDTSTKPKISEVIPSNLCDLNNYEFNFPSSNLTESDIETAFETVYCDEYDSNFYDDYSNLFRLHFNELEGTLQNENSYTITSTDSTYFSSDSTGVTFTNFSFAE